MTDDTGFKRVKDLFLQALEREGRDREALLRGVEDPAVAAEVSSLLSAHEAAGEFIERPRVVGQSGLLEAITGTWAVGRRIDRYQVTRQLGRGSLGIVFQARNVEGGDDVALELLAPEVQALVGGDAVAGLVRRVGELEHPHLARLVATGRTPEGLPWLAAEYVRGTPLTQYADRAALPVVARLALFRQLLAALSYAHQAGLVHGDLKPRNVPVTPQGEVRLIDLGLSALLAGVVRSTLPAGARLPSATTPYSSPEQVRGEELTAASDLYSAGALLYELLVGQPPHGAVAQSAEGLRRAILGHQAERPSAAAVAPVVVDAGVGSLAARWPEQMAARRGTDPAGLSRQLESLDDLVLRMLAKMLRRGRRAPRRSTPSSPGSPAPDRMVRTAHPTGNRVPRHTVPAWSARAHAGEAALADLEQVGLGARRQGARRVVASRSPSMRHRALLDQAARLVRCSARGRRRRAALQSGAARRRATSSTSSGTPPPAKTRSNSSCAPSRRGLAVEVGDQPAGELLLDGLGVQLARPRPGACGCVELGRRDVGEQQVPVPHQGVGDRHRLAVDLARRILDRDRVAEALRHLLDAVGADEERHGEHDLRLHALFLHQVAADEQVEDLVVAAELDVGLHARPSRSPGRAGRAARAGGSAGRLAKRVRKSSRSIMRARV